MREENDFPDLGWEGLNRALPMHQGFRKNIKLPVKCMHEKCPRMIIDTHRELWNRFDPLGGFICAICAGYERRLGGGGTEAGRAARIKFLDSAVNGGIRENRARLPRCGNFPCTGIPSACWDRCDTCYGHRRQLGKDRIVKPPGLQGNTKDPEEQCTGIWPDGQRCTTKRKDVEAFGGKGLCKPCNQRKRAAAEKLERERERAANPPPTPPPRINLDAVCLGANGARCSKTRRDSPKFWTTGRCKQCYRAGRVARGLSR